MSRPPHVASEHETGAAGSIVQDGEVGAMTGSVVDRGTPTGAWQRKRRRIFVVAAWALTIILAALFTLVIALTFILWLQNPASALTTPVTDLAFAGLGASIVAGIACQLRPDRPVIGLAQSLLGALALAGAGAVSHRDEPRVGGMLMALLVGGLWVLRPRREAERRVERVDLRLVVAGVVGLAAALPLASYAVGRALESVPACYLGRCATSDRFPELAAAIILFPLLVLLAATRLPGWRLPMWTSALSTIVLGIAALILPHAPSSPGTVGGAFSLVWGGVLATFLIRHRKRKASR